MERAHQIFSLACRAKMASTDVVRGASPSWFVVEQLGDAVFQGVRVAVCEVVIADEPHSRSWTARCLSVMSAHSSGCS